MSGLARANSVNDSVKERRLRPLYDLLDAGNCKKVVHESEKLLKKQPGFSCAKVFKAIAYMRMGKLDECMALLLQVADEVPTDESTLHAMQICYRELDMPEKVCQMYEAACKKDKNEDHMSAWFMSNVRVMDFVNQHKIALNLYKTYNKGSYLLWAVMSLYMKSVFTDTPDIANTITLPLAARMIQKYIEDTPNVTENDVFFHTMILTKMEKHSEAYNALSRRPPTAAHNTFLNMLEKECLKSLNDRTKLRGALERMIIEKPSDIGPYMDYMEFCGGECPEEIKKFFTNLAYGSSGEVQNRVALLALINLSVLVIEEDIESLRKLFVDYFSKYGAKPFFLRDLIRVFNRLRERNDSSTMKAIVETMKEHCGEAYNLTVILQWKTNFECLQYFFIEDTILSDPVKAIRCLASMMTNYLNTDLHFKRVNPQDPRDPLPYEDYLITASMLLLKTFWNKLGYWNGYYLSSDFARLNTNVDGSKSEHDHTKENGETKGQYGRPYEWFEGEFPIALALALLEYGVQNSPYCHAYRVLLGKTYFFVGAAPVAVEQIMHMELKHMQYDTLGYLYVPRTLQSGILSESVRVLHLADSFYAQTNREMMEHVISAYKFGTWHKVPEFMNLRSLIETSQTRWEVKVEKRLFEFTKDGNDRDSIIKIAQREEFDVVPLEQNFTDNRDFQIHSFVYEGRMCDKLRALSFHDIVIRLRIRGALLAMLSNFVRALTVHGTTNSPLYVKRAKQACDYLCVQMDQPLDQFKFNLQDQRFWGPWFPTTYEYVNSGMLCCIRELQNLIYMAAIIDSNDTAQKESLIVEIQQLGEKIKTCFSGWVTSFKCVDISLINMRNLNEDIFTACETLGFLCTMVDLLKGFLEKSTPPPQGSDNKGKKKKAKEVSVEFPWLNSYNNLAEDILFCVESVENELVKLEAASKTWYPSQWSQQQHEFWKTKVSEDVLRLLEKMLPTVTSKLGDSYTKAYEEMRTLIQRKKQYLKSLVHLPH